MNFDTKWQSLSDQSISNGDFDYNNNHTGSFASLLSDKNVSKGYGVYAIFGINQNHEDLIYIGMAGTIKNGSICKQGLRKRLNRIAFKVNGVAVARRDVYMYLLGLLTENEEKSQLIQQRYPDIPTYEKLHFKWLETYPKNGNSPPIFAEKALLEAFYNDYRRLPIMNKRM